MTARDAWIRALDYSKNAAHLTLHELIDRAAGAFSDRLALLDGHNALTYGALISQANRYARWALERGLVGDSVGLLLPNCPDYVALWLGLTRVGCKVALLNIHLRGEALHHSLTSVQATHLITHGRAVLAAEQPGSSCCVWRWPMEQFLRKLSAAPLTEMPLPSVDSVALYVYTSGTTGLPKAIKITHRRVVEWSCWFAGMMDAKPDDRLYNCLPMYHSVGGITAIGSVLAKGGSVYIRERFSASQFWDEIVDYGCTIFQYIGELCRYLTLVAPHPKERLHRLRLACGNGLNPEVWQVFQKRFAISSILEFYAATEGALSLYNCEGKPGAVGRVPPFLARQFGVAIVRCDPETGEPLRNHEGFCVPCALDEPGEALSQITDTRQFDGYTDHVASSRKILTRVFKSGDRWYRSGDLMRRDAAGYFYFVDRLGDTFRWKGENVSTTEVAVILQSCPGVVDAVVYGVPVAGNDGRVGMAALVANDDFLLNGFATHCLARLPVYARPMFIRLCTSLDLTSTFKLTKADLIREGSENSSGPVWQMDQKTGELVPHRI